MDDFLQILDSILQEVSAGSNYTIILSGDFNIDLAKGGVVSDFFVDMLRSYIVQQTIIDNLHQTITNPTRITARSQTIIDNIFVNLVDCDGDVIVSALSDHCAERISFKIQDAPIDKTRKLKMRFSHQKLQLIKKELEAVDWTPVLCDMDVNRCYDSFMASCDKEVTNFSPNLVGSSFGQIHSTTTKVQLGIIILCKKEEETRRLCREVHELDGITNPSLRKTLMALMAKPIERLACSGACRRSLKAMIRIKPEDAMNELKLLRNEHPMTPKHQARRISKAGRDSLHHT
ncbi:hypothetical protein QE152_g18036 [Popillia japonica]|uniref:Endonuclease/exonuclease/phosphatase domain-containing protein n=1 Tax=Popillia japonica TaxID=7064 RepID=A0AAW1L4H3_POPJA